MNNRPVVILISIMILGVCIALAMSRSTTSSTFVFRGTSFYGGTIKQANGSTTVTLTREEINKLELGNNRRFNTEIRLEVEQGSVRLELLDEKEQPTASAVSTPGRPALVRGYLVAATSGDVKYRIIATEAENINYSFTIQP
jgi:hypothetical protein